MISSVSVSSLLIRNFELLELVNDLVVVGDTSLVVELHYCAADGAAPRDFTSLQSTLNPKAQPNGYYQQ